MKTNFLLRHELKISRIGQLVVFLASIRLITECFRLDAFSETSVNMLVLKPFLIGALITAIASMGMTIIAFYKKYILNILISVLTIASLVTIKIIYHL